MNKIIIVLVGVCLIISCKDELEEKQAQKIIELENKLNAQEKEKLEIKDAQLKLKEKELTEKEEKLNRKKRPVKKEKALTQQEIIDQNQGEPETKFAIINDPDGYTNVRSKPSTKSKIIEKVYDGERFEVYTEDHLNKNWWSVYIQKSHTNGYIHKSRVRILK